MSFLGLGNGKEIGIVVLDFGLGLTWFCVLVIFGFRKW